MTVFYCYWILNHMGYGCNYTERFAACRWARLFNNR